MKKMLQYKMVFLILFMFLLNSVMIFADTVDDVRELLGLERVDGIYSNEQVQNVISEYKKIEKENEALKYFELSNQINDISDLEEKYNEMEIKVIEAQDALATSFQNGGTVEDVIKCKSKLESVLYEISTMKSSGYNFNIEYKPNIWEEDYVKVQTVVQNFSDDFDIGVLGEGIKFPLDMESVRLTDIYGLRYSETEKTVVMHNGVDFTTSLGASVYSLWNGVVSNIYESETEGLTIEISHGKALKTVYSNVKNVIVDIGQEVTQYQRIADVDGKDNNGLTYLHFEVILDDSHINPIYLFGDKGLNAFRIYVSNHPNDYSEYQSVKESIKDVPIKDTEKDDNNDNDNDMLEIEDNSDSLKFSVPDFYKNLEEQAKKELEKNGISEIE